MQRLKHAAGALACSHEHAHTAHVIMPRAAASRVAWAQSACAARASGGPPSHDRLRQRDAERKRRGRPVAEAARGEHRGNRLGPAAQRRAA